MLKKVVVEVIVESVLEGDIRVVPVNRISEIKGLALLNWHKYFICQVNLNNLFSHKYKCTVKRLNSDKTYPIDIVRNNELLVSGNVGFIINDVSNCTKNWQIIFFFQ